MYICRINSLKGNHHLARGNALGKGNQKEKSPEGAKAQLRATAPGIFIGRNWERTRFMASMSCSARNAYHGAVHQPVNAFQIPVMPETAHQTWVKAKM